MKAFLTILIVHFLLPALSINKTEPSKNNLITFNENKGQVSDQNYKPRPDVLFSGTDGGLVFHLKKDGISYQLSKVQNDKVKNDLRYGISKEKIIEANNIAISRIDMNWLNTNPNSFIHKGEMLFGHNNYYLSVCPNGVTNVKGYKDITYKNIYDGIDLCYYSKENHLKYDFIIKPNGNYKQIQIKVNGAEKLSVNSKGELIISTPLGEIIEQTPLVIQNKKILPAKWILNESIVSFQIENVNPLLPLIIDPLVRTWGTYYGDGDSRGYACAVDTISGNVYLAGQSSLGTNSVIATSGGYQTSLGGNYDAFLVQFDAAGVRQWATFYGGLYGENSSGCVTDGSGNVYMLGTTTSSNAIASPGAHQTVFGGNYDAFLVKFNSSGVRQWATYYGAFGTEWGNGCAIDAAGNIYITGESNSSLGIVTAGAHQTTLGGGYDGFLVKFNSIGVRQWATYYGDNGIDRGVSCAADPMGNINMVGQTSSTLTSVISTSGSHQINNNGFEDAFIAQFNSSGVRQWGTYYGGVGSDVGSGCAVDLIGNIYISGSTNSNPSTLFGSPGCHQPNFAGVYDAFLAKFNSSGVRQWGTYYGGSGSDVGVSCKTDAFGNVYLAGHSDTNVGVSIASVGSYQAIFGGATDDAYLAKFNSVGTRLWGTYYGGAGVDYGYQCAPGPSGDVYLAGQTSTSSGNIMFTAGCHDSTFDGISNAYLVKFNDIGNSNVISENIGFMENINVYPNPASDFITVETGNNEAAIIEILDALGRILIHEEVKFKSKLNNIYIGHLQNGIYFARIISEDQISQQVKIVKE